jgi:chromosome segregation ATPase
MSEHEIGNPSRYPLVIADLQRDLAAAQAQRDVLANDKKVLTETVEGLEKRYQRVVANIKFIGELQSETSLERLHYKARAELAEEKLAGVQDMLVKAFDERDAAQARVGELTLERDVARGAARRLRDAMIRASTMVRHDPGCSGCDCGSYELAYLITDAIALAPKVREA